MKLACIGTSTARCLLLTLRKTNILLDCGLWGCSGVLHSCYEAHSHGLPKHLVPLLQLLECYEIEAALMSTPDGMLALPLLLSAAPGLIQGPIHATTAALDVAHHLVLELQAAAPALVHGSGPGAGQAAAGAGRGLDLNSSLLSLTEAVQARCQDPLVFQSCWVDMYSTHTAQAFFEKVKAVRYGQEVSLNGYELSARAYPAGSGFGHALWTIIDGCRRVGYLSSFQMGAGGHALELEPQTLSGLDALITAPGCVDGAGGTVPGAAGPDVSAAPLLPPAPANPGDVHQPLLPAQQRQQVLQQMHGSTQRTAQQLKQAVLTAVTEGGSVLLPVPASGLAWDVVEAVARMLEVTDMGEVPLLYISPCAQDSLALANTSMEFLNLQRQARAYVPEPAFAFQALQASGRLVLACSLEEAAVKQPGCLDRPCVVVTSAASLAYGPGAQLLRRWGSDPRCALVLPKGSVGCAPAVMTDALRAAHPTLLMRVAVGDMGAAADACQLALLLAQLQAPPAQLLMSWADAQQLGKSLQGLGRSLEDCRTQLHTYGWMDVLNIKLPKHMVHVSVPPSMLQSACWQPAPHDLDVVTAKLSGTLLHEQGRGWQLRPAPGQGRSAKTHAPRATMSSHHPSGPTEPPAGWQPSAEAILQSLQDRGHEACITIASQPSFERFIRIPSLDAHIQLHDYGAKIISSDNAVRELLSRCITDQYSGT